MGTLDSRDDRNRVSSVSESCGTEPHRLILSSPVLPRGMSHSMKPGPCSGSNAWAKIEWDCKKKCVYFCDFPLCLLTVL